jgi:hypothetical protein
MKSRGEAEILAFGRSGRSRDVDGKIFWKNTMDLQWNMRANYNARPCADERKVAGAKTMGNNGKNNAKNNGNSRGERLERIPFLRNRNTL